MINTLFKYCNNFFKQNNNVFSASRSIRSGTDFGNYSCVAANSLGTFKYVLIFIKTVFIISLFRKHIEVHGRPTAAIFRSKPNTHQDQVRMQVNKCCC